jgi:hypothetical protein
MHLWFCKIVIIEELEKKRLEDEARALMGKYVYVHEFIYMYIKAA